MTPDQPTAEQLAQRARDNFAPIEMPDIGGIGERFWDEADSALNALLALAQRTEQADANYHATLEQGRLLLDQRDRALDRAEQAEKERDHLRLKYKRRCGQLNAAEAERDRLAAALERFLDAAEKNVIPSLDQMEVVSERDRAAFINASYVAREALNPRPDPDLAGDYAAEWKDGEPPQEQP